MAPKTLSEIRASRPQIDHAKIAATTEEDIRRHAVEDGQDPDQSLDGFVASTRSIRARLGMTQEQFASALRVPVATLRNWEQGRVALDPAVVSLLTIVARHPTLALNALREASEAE